MLITVHKLGFSVQKLEFLIFLSKYSILKKFVSRIPDRTPAWPSGSLHFDSSSPGRACAYVHACVVLTRACVPVRVRCVPAHTRAMRVTGALPGTALCCTWPLLAMPFARTLAACQRIARPSALPSCLDACDVS